MKKVLVFTAFSFILAACSNTEQYKPKVDELAAKWDATTAAVTEFSNNVKSEQSNWMNSMNEMQVAPDAMATWDEASKTKYNEIQTSAQTTSANMAAVSSELDSFMPTWQEKTAELQSLKDGIAEGKVEGDVEAKITDLENTVTEAQSKLDSWKSKFEEVKSAAEQNRQMYAEFKSGMPAETGKM